MRDSKGIIVGIVLSILYTSLAICGITINDQISIDGNLRFRTEIDDRDFNSNTGAIEYNYLRTQLGFKIQASPDIIVRVKFKDSRFLGTTRNNDKSTSSVDLQEGYVLVNNLLDTGFDLQFGRFEMIYGRRRIHGNGGWNNFGPRTFDGIRFLYKEDYGQWDLFGVRVVERGFDQQPYNWPNYNVKYETEDFFSLTSKTDWNRFGPAGNLLGGKFQPLLIVDWAPGGMSSIEKKDQVDADLVIMPGFYANNRFANFHFDLDAAIQSGKKNDRDLFAWLIAADVRYHFPTGLKPYIGFGIDMTSGNGKENKSGDEHVFYVPFMSRHIYRGYMDYFQDVENGMIDWIARLGFIPWKNASLAIDIHNFQFLEEAYDSKGKAIDQLGQEYDLRFIVPIAEALSLDSAVCFFTPVEDAVGWIYKSAGTNNDISSFFYLALTASF